MIRISGGQYCLMPLLPRASPTSSSQSTPFIPIKVYLLIAKFSIAADLNTQMFAASAARARLANTLVARRGFSTTRAQLASPYHYAEGPRTNIPFNPLTRFFAVRYWLYMSMLLQLKEFGLLIVDSSAVGFGTPFVVAGMFFELLSHWMRWVLNIFFFQSGKPSRPNRRRFEATALPVLGMAGYNGMLHHITILVSFVQS